MSNLFLPKNDPKHDLLISKIVADVVSQHFSLKSSDYNIVEYKTSFNYKNIYSYYFLVKTLIYFFVFFLNTKKLIDFEIEGVNIGIAAYSSTLRNYKVYSSKPLLAFRLLSQFILATIAYTSSLRIAQNAEAVYIKDIAYRSRILFDVCMVKNVRVYMHTYPFGLVYLENSKFTSLNIVKYPYPKAQFNDNQYHDYMTNRIQSPEKSIPYYHAEKTNKDFHLDVDKDESIVLIYAHSFTDAQLYFGFDGFTNVLDWLNFTLDNLIQKNIRIIIKGHPNFWAVGFAAPIIAWDIKIWKDVQLKYKKFNNIEFIDFPVSNNEVLSKLDKENTVIISHHTNAIVEAAYLGFKTISSACSPWGDNYYSFCEIWDSKKSYLDLLRNIESIRPPVESKLKNFVYDKYMYDLCYHGKLVWYSQLASELGLKVSEVIRDPTIITLDKFINYEKTIKNISLNIKAVV